MSRLFGIFILSLISATHSKYTQLPECPLSDDITFPNDFVFGAASSAYQIEGGWNANGKGPSIWDEAAHTMPEFVVDETNGDIAADSYHKYMEDVKALNDTGVCANSLILIFIFCVF